MTCADLQSGLSLYLYGELDFAEEEAFETHLAGCAFCQSALNREKEWHAAVYLQSQDFTPEWLAACRTDFHEKILREPTSSGLISNVIAGWWVSLFDVRTTERSYQFAAVSFLILLGFSAGRWGSLIRLPWESKTLVRSASVLEAPTTQIQEVRAESGNRVRIVLQQVQVREVLGDRNDDGVRELLVGAVRASEDPAVRMDSVEMLAGQSGVEIRNALVNTLRNDTNAAVRMKAVDSLRRFPSDSVTREALEFTLAHDLDPGVRTEAMDVLVPFQGDFQVTPQLLETMSRLMHSEQTDEYLRRRCAQVLNDQVVFNAAH